MERNIGKHCSSGLGDENKNPCARHIIIGAGCRPNYCIPTFIQ